MDRGGLLRGHIRRAPQKMRLRRGEYPLSSSILGTRSSRAKTSQASQNRWARLNAAIFSVHPLASFPVSISLIHDTAAPAIRQKLAVKRPPHVLLRLSCRLTTTHRPKFPIVGDSKSSASMVCALRPRPAYQSTSCSETRMTHGSCRQNSRLLRKRIERNDGSARSSACATSDG